MLIGALAEIIELVQEEFNHGLGHVDLSSLILLHDLSILNHGHNMAIISRNNNKALYFNTL